MDFDAKMIDKELLAKQLPKNEIVSDDKLNGFLATLPPRELVIFCLRFQNPPWTLRAIGQRLPQYEHYHGRIIKVGISPERVRQIEAKTLRKFLGRIREP